MSDLRARFGRRLRLGMIGGGPDSWIGRMHQGAAQLDGWYRDGSKEYVESLCEWGEA